MDRSVPSAWSAWTVFTGTAGLQRQSALHPLRLDINLLLDGGISFQDIDEGRHHSPGLGLLQHHFADQGAARIIGIAPRKLTLMGRDTT